VKHETVDMQNLLVSLATCAGLAAETGVDRHGYARHDVGGGEGPAYRWIQVRLLLPDGMPRVTAQTEQRFLFDRLIESLSRDSELLDFFATKLMEKLGGAR